MWGLEIPSGPWAVPPSGRLASTSSEVIFSITGAHMEAVAFRCTISDARWEWRWREGGTLGGPICVKEFFHGG